MKNISFYFSLLSIFSTLSCFAQDVDQTKDLNLKLPESQSNVVDHCMRFDKQNRVLTKDRFEKEESRVVSSYYFEAVDKKIKDATNQMPLPQKVKYANKILDARVELTIADTGDLCSVRILESNSDDFSKWVVDSINKAAPFAPFPAQIANETNLIRKSNRWSYDATRRIRYY
ncbi:MAG: TonB C-terminal domain-containing protein [Methylophilus sp.]|nr:TonB C-terminal domain-containing protein [Methylophilus sp.]